MIISNRDYRYILDDRLFQKKKKEMKRQANTAITW